MATTCHDQASSVVFIGYVLLQGDSKSAERDALREIEHRFDDDVTLTDLREAFVKVGLEHLDEVEIHLEGWGYGMRFDE